MIRKEKNLEVPFTVSQDFFFFLVEGGNLFSHKTRIVLNVENDLESFKEIRVLRDFIF